MPNRRDQLGERNLRLERLVGLLETPRHSIESPCKVFDFVAGANGKMSGLAVLIGGFRDVDAAGSQLKKVRKLDLPTIELNSGKPACDTYDVYEQTADKRSYELKRYAVNPFHTAFVIRNPTIAHQRQTAFLATTGAPGAPPGHRRCVRWWDIIWGEAGVVALLAVVIARASDAC